MTQQNNPMTQTKNTSTTSAKPVWFITGCSTGFGRELASHVLECGYRAVITARDPEKIRDLGSKGEAQILELDVTDQGEVDAAIHAAEERFGRIDVLVNNAGIGYFAAVEESEEEQVRKMFEVNVFGMGRMIQAALPGMRRQAGGSIVNVSSIAGLVGFPALGYYNASKFAVEGLSAALRKELEPLGISVMVVEPSGFRTDWAGRSANESKTTIEAYAETAGTARSMLRSISGKQEGDPVRAAQAIVKAIESGNPPPHLLLGNAAFDGAMANLAELRKQFSAGETVSRNADFPPKVQ